MRRVPCLVLGLVASLAMAAPASAVTLVGSDLTTPPGGAFASPPALTMVQTTPRPGSNVPVAAPASGVLVRMTVRYLGPSAQSTLKFRILSGTSPVFTARPATPNITVAAGAPSGTANSDPVDASGDPIGIPIAMGEHIAVVVPNTIGMIGGAPGGVVHTLNGSHDSGQMAYTAPPPIGADSELGLRGVIEPDGDGDHYGDETQDACPNDASVHEGACPVDLSVATTAAPSPAVQGQVVTYTMTVRNNDAADTAAGVVLQTGPPPGADFVSVDAAPDSCIVAVPIGCSLGTLAPGATRSVTLVVRPTVRGVLTHTAGVSATGSDPNLANNSSSLDVDVKDKSKPAVSAFKRTKTGFSYKLSEPARVVIKVARRCRKGRGGCRTGFKTARTLRQDGKKGKNSRALPGKGLKPGRYRATLVAKDPAGNASAPKRVGFTLRRAR